MMFLYFEFSTALQLFLFYLTAFLYLSAGFLRTEIACLL